MWILKLTSWALSILVLPLPVAGTIQQTDPDTAIAFRVSSPIKVDGRLDEPEWAEARHIQNFTQRELNLGQPATERTEAAILYTETDLYIGAWCYDSEPDRLTAKKMRRDFNIGAEDDFEIVIDTYHDRRNGYLFATNPNGARFDALVLDNGRKINRDWDGVWKVAVQVTDSGWFAEFDIPFSTLRLSSAGEQVWGINFERNIRRKLEQVLWQGWSRDSELEQVSRAGTLVGLHGLRRTNLVEFKPYGTLGVEKPRLESTHTVADMGGDLNYLITPTLKLQLTANTDFAQVESDRVQVNLTRFSLYYPEKREFFLEGQNIFDFALGGRIRPFYSRRIGLAPDRSEIPIIGGVRLMGKHRNSTLGAMSIQTAKTDSIPTANFTILRWKQDVLDQSTFGLIGVGKFEAGRRNATYGTDWLYSTDNLFGDKNLELGGAYAQSYTSDSTREFGDAQRIFVSYPNDFVEFDASWERSAEDFNPEVGFLRRRSYRMTYVELQFNPRPAFLPWLRQMEFKPVDFNYYVDDRTGALQTFWSEYRPLGFGTKSGEFFEFNIQRTAEKLDEEFEIYEGITIPAAEYWFTHYEIQLATFRGRPWSVYFFLNWGDFYTGSRTEWSGRVIWRLNKYLSVSGDFQRNDIRLSEGGFQVNEVGGRLEFAATPNLFGSVFGQWNDEDQEILLNFWADWIPRPGTDLFFVVNQFADTGGPGVTVTKTTVLTKLVWRFVL